MPWCPNCKTEYQDGVKECSDCKTTLVDKLEDEPVSELIPFFMAEDKKVAEKLANFFNYSNLHSAVSYDEENDCYIVSIDPERQLEAKKLYQAFYIVESERMQKNESEKSSKADTDIINESQTEDADTDTITVSADSPESNSPIIIEEEDDYDLDADSLYEAHPKKAADSVQNSDSVSDDEDDDSPYIMKADRYKDLMSTVWLFLIFGIGGLIFILLNVVGILDVFNYWLPYVIMSALFIFFIYVAISTYSKARKLKAEIAEEENMIKQINEWLESHVTEDFLRQINDEGATTEVNYLKQTKTIKDMLIEEFGKQNPAFLDRLIEEYYSRTFDKTVE